MMFQHQIIKSCWHGRDCRIPFARYASVVLLALVCVLLISGLARAVDHSEINVMPAECARWSTNLNNNVSTAQGDIIVNDGAVIEIENATVKSDIL